MSLSPPLLLAAVLMGLAGGPHCAAMCGAACTGFTRVAPGRPGRALLQFQAGRLVGYAAAGAACATAAQALAWITTQTAALRPAWTLMHLLVLAWGLTLLVLARQPAWAQRAGLAVWGHVRPMVQRSGGLFGAGVLWTFMPCGLLWSALLVAALSGHALQGAVSMALFALGSGVGLAALPGLLAWVKAHGRLRQDWGTRIAGGLLALMSALALWLEVAHQIALWCA